MVYRILVEKKPAYAVEARSVFHDIVQNLGIDGCTGVRILQRYDIEGMSSEELRMTRETIFSEPPLDLVDEQISPPEEGSRVFAVEYLPGQYDQRADSAGQAVMLLTHKTAPEIRTARVYIINGSIQDSDFEAVKKYIINPVESREAGLEPLESLHQDYPEPGSVRRLDGFISMDEEALRHTAQDLGLAMSLEDLRFCREYFGKTEERDPSLTEIRMIDTYWSDHCRHTTFLTHIDSVTFAPGPYTRALETAFSNYKTLREEVYKGGNKPVTLMDIAVIAAKALKSRGILDDLDESEEINACSIRFDARVDGRSEPWLLMFKNETHNHPTEIEPFGGAATCLGGAIRDPLSGRSYVYQAMRVTGAGDPRVPVSETMPGKLPQRKICTVAAHGYSSYGNQIGLATGQVSELYHPGYVAKRMEIGAVIGAAPARNVRREVPAPGDKVILLGGRTGRDGIGGATGSSKEHTQESLETCGAEVQKGNPPTERKIQRLFRNEEVTTLIKRCNDFGAGGVSVAIGELADGLRINLDRVPRKYEGLDGTELAISESQERMAVVISAADVEKFIACAADENLEAVTVAEVTEEPRLVMEWKGDIIVDLSRSFLDSNGVEGHTRAEIVLTEEMDSSFCNESGPDALKKALSSTGQGSRKGLAEAFDSTIGSSTVLMPFGGKHQLTPAEGMAALIPVLRGTTTTASLMTWGCDPWLMEKNPFLGAAYAVICSLSKITAMGGDYVRARLTFQEYFEKLKTEEQWGKPLSALLGALEAQMAFGTPAIGGKDSMSGTFMDLSVPPTLVSFAVTTADASEVISPELKQPGSSIYLVPVPADENGLPDYPGIKDVFLSIRDSIRRGSVLSAGVIDRQLNDLASVQGKAAEMAFGNMLGLSLESRVDITAPVMPGSLIIEGADARAISGCSGAVFLGKVLKEEHIEFMDGSLPLSEFRDSWASVFDEVYPRYSENQSEPDAGDIDIKPEGIAKKIYTGVKSARPRVIIPVFPGTNCEYDTARAFEAAGALPKTVLIRNLTPQDIEDSIAELAGGIDEAHIVMIPGGFSAGDEPEGSGKFIASFFRNPRIEDAVAGLLADRDGLMLGICNGFQALIKLGLLPYGEIKPQNSDSPSLTFNTIGHHVSALVQTRTVNTHSPWLRLSTPGEIHTVAVSHGEGRFIADEEHLDALVKNGQIAYQYVDDSGEPARDMPWNPNGSAGAIEGITSPDGRILGKMGHSERRGNYLYKNVPGEKDQKIFEAGVAYFS